MSYAKGRRLEYRIKESLERKGYFVSRSAGSHGVDVVAISQEKEILFVSCKYSQYIRPKERKELLELARRYNAKAMTTVKRNGRWVLEEVKE